MTFKLTQDKNKQMQQQKIEEQKNKTIDNLGVMMRHNLLHIVWISILNFEFLNFWILNLAFIVVKCNYAWLEISLLM